MMGGSGIMWITVTGVLVAFAGGLLNNTVCSTFICPLL